MAGCAGAVLGSGSNGGGASALLQITPAQINFGYTATGTTSKQEVDVYNSGSEAAEISSVSVQGASFAISGLSLPVSVPAGGSAQFIAEFSPKANGKVQGGLSITSNAQNSSLVMPLSGTGASTALEVVPLSVQFGKVPLGIENSQSIQVMAMGKDSVTVRSIAVGGQFFSFSGPKLPQTLSPGKSITITAAFRPGSVGSNSGAITIISDAPDSNLQVPVAGTGVKAAVELHWDASSSPDVLGYYVYRSSVANGTFTKLNAVADASLSYSDAAVSSGHTYYYVVTAVNSKNVESAFSAPESVSVP